MSKSTDRSKRIAKLLGMPYGTASHRLRKLVLFNVLKKHGENLCFMCSEVIESAEDLSIEHIRPWEGRSADLFWDLSNITFSHLACNKQHLFHGGRYQRILSPEGMSWCSTCLSHKMKSEFSANLG